MAKPRESGSTVSIPETIPLIPTRNTVVFPTGVIGLQVSRARTARLSEALDESGQVVGIFHHVETEAEPSGDDLDRIGVAAEVVQVLRLDEGRYQLFLHGLCRVLLLRMEQEDPYLVGRVRPARAPETAREVDLDALMGKALSAFETLTVADDRYGKDTVDVLRMNVARGPELFSDLLAGYLNNPVEERKRLVEMLSPSERMVYLVDLIEQEIARAAVQTDIQSQVRRQIEEKRREYVLREQLRVIQEALGENQGPQRVASDFAAEVEKLPLDEESRATLRRECDRLSLLSEQSTEYPVQRGYLETVMSLPWTDRTRDRLDLRRVERELNRSHHGVAEVKERVLEYLSVAKLRERLAGPVICFLGPPGTGKTTLARAIADALERNFIRISLGGVSDESEVRGHRKTYVGAMPGRIISAYRQVGSRNPVLLLDEIDKLGQSSRGDPSAALLEALDPQQNMTFTDHYLGVPFDLSETLFIATANRADPIPPALRDRFEMIRLSGYTEDEKIEIARRYVLPRAQEHHGLGPRTIQVSPETLRALIRSYTAEAGVRDLERRVATLCRRIARVWARRKSDRKAVRIREEDLPSYLGPPVYHQEYASRSPEVGIATGLAWTGLGGAVLFIEAAKMPGSGRVKVTGRLGEVMRESVDAAYTYVRSRADSLEIDTEKFRQVDVHIHFPEGATPKDGPSAGVAVATCLASLLSGRPIRHDVAMTGEITLRGKVLSVGGVQEKLMAAHRARIRTVILPEGNRKDLMNVPEVTLSELNVLFAERVSDVWKEAMVPLVVIRKEDLGGFREEDYLPPFPGGGD